MLTLNKSCVERTHELLLVTRSKSGKFSFFNARPGFFKAFWGPIRVPRIRENYHGSLKSEKIGSLESEKSGPNRSKPGS